jgi:hypothetical protein
VIYKARNEINRAEFYLKLLKEDDGNEINGYGFIDGYLTKMNFGMEWRKIRSY